MVELNFGLGEIISFILGIIASVVSQIALSRHFRPRIIIDDNVVIRQFDLTDNNGRPVTFNENRISIRSRGSVV